MKMKGLICRCNEGIDSIFRISKIVHPRVLLRTDRYCCSYCFSLHIRFLLPMHTTQTDLLLSPSSKNSCGTAYNYHLQRCVKCLSFSRIKLSSLVCKTCCYKIVPQRIHSLNGKKRKANLLQVIRKHQDFWQKIVLRQR